MSGPPGGDVRRPAGPSLTPWRLVREVRRTGPLALVDGIARAHPRIAYFRLGREHAYLLSAPDLARTLLVDLGRVTAKGRGLERARELLGDGLLTSEGSLHQRQRRRIQPAFHASGVGRYAEVMRAEARALSAGWRDGDVVDMRAEMSRLTLRIVARSLFGTDLADADLRLVGASLTTFLGSFLARMMPAGEALGRLPTTRNRRLRRTAEELDGLIYRLIGEHRAVGDTGDLLSTLLAATDAEGRGDGCGGRMHDRLVRDEVLTLLLAGHETTANALCWSWLLLADAPRAAARLHAELDARPTADRVTDRRGRAGVDTLPYTRAVVAESMRLRPPSWLVSRRLTAPAELDGYVLPAGSLVATSQWVLHGDPRWWGADADVFRPERWLDAGGRFDEAAPGQPRGAYLPFGAGRRVCVGEHFAWTEAVLVLAELARCWTPAATVQTRHTARAAVTLRPVMAPLCLRSRR